MIEKSRFLACPPALAFELLTDRASEWWPEPLRHTADPRSEIRMVSTGRFWERSGDGHEVELGRVLAWDTARQLVLDFFPGTDDDHPTKVVITFEARGDGTWITVAHSPKPESSGMWEERAHRFEWAWGLVLPALGDAADAIR